MAAIAPFGKRLKQARTQLGISQKKLGLLAGIEESNASAMMNQYERDTHIPVFTTVRNIADALNVPTAYFYADEDDLAELLMLYASLNSKNQKALLEDLRGLKQPGEYEKSYTAPAPTIHEK